MKKLIFSCFAAFALVGVASAEERDFASEVKHFHETPAEITSHGFNDEETNKILSRLDAHMTTWNHCLNDLDPGVAEDDPICNMAKEELELYLDHIIKEGNKELLETAM